MRVADFDYDLPVSLIAQEPLAERDRSRLLVLHRGSGALEHRSFPDLLDYLRPGDALVLNDTRVLPARLSGRRPGGGRVEVLLLHPAGDGAWEGLVRPGRKVPPGTVLTFGEGVMEARVMEKTASGGRVLAFSCRGDFGECLNTLGRTPLPPYIKKPLTDASRYQTVYAREPGSAAAPTAGLHFTPSLLARIEGRGVAVVKVLLHVGLDTFRPVREEEVEDHLIHTEYYAVDETSSATLRRVAEGGGRIVAVGTTVVRCLESAADDHGEVRAGEGRTGIFIYPGYRFRVVDSLLTNFHLPRSTLLMLVSALAGRERVLAAYREAVAQGYRFFSFGDAMLIV
ncbi:MAG: tRNA preQ1(34) S-adenosylmethionine ribosyltransferase-isomerase QueA [Peptococcaceae bacterium]|nr:tRNA preQ1(34) S-adenosylmethionine ribosyltransferase-isomerase QueA [Peptococcaceae bacterium]